MARKLKKKDSKFRGLLHDTEGQVSSFEGRINSGPLKHYISVCVDDEWLTIAQAKRLARILDEHIERVEVAKGLSVMSGSKRYRKKSPANAIYIGYGDERIDRFLKDVEKVARNHFINWEQDYKWKVLEGQKTELVMNFQTWVSTVKAR